METENILCSVALSFYISDMLVLSAIFMVFFQNSLEHLFFKISRSYLEDLAHKGRVDAS